MTSKPPQSDNDEDVDGPYFDLDELRKLAKDERNINFGRNAGDTKTFQLKYSDEEVSKCIQALKSEDYYKTKKYQDERTGRPRYDDVYYTTHQPAHKSSDDLIYVKMRKSGHVLFIDSFKRSDRRRRAGRRRK